MKRSKIPQEFQSFLPCLPVSGLDLDRDKTYIIQSLLRNSNLQAGDGCLIPIQKMI